MTTTDTPFQWKTLSSICSRITSGGTPARRRASEFFTPQGHPWVKTKELLDNAIFDTEEHITDLAIAQSSAKLLPVGTVLLAMYASPTVGRLGFLRTEAACNQACAALLVDPALADARYVFYALRNERERLQRIASGSAQQNINARIVKEFAIPVPELREQERIALLLGALDDKIDSNRRLAALLEETAAALFRGRFIDLIGAVDLEDSEIGLVPRGWAVRPLQDVVQVLRRGVSPKYVNSGGVCVLNQKCIRDFRVAAGPSRRHDGQARSVDGREVEPGDVLINSTGVGTLGRLAQVRYLSEPTIVDSHITVVRADQEVILADYLAMALFAAQPAIEALGEGSTGQTELGRARLGALPILVPPLDVQDEYLRAASALRARTDGAERESLILAEVRDTLLPKLVSGGLRLAEAEEAFGAV